jgi:hypothetical protein
MRNTSLRRLGAGCLGSLGLLAAACGDGAPASEPADDGEGGSSGAQTAAATSAGGEGSPVTAAGPSTSASASTSVTTGAGGAHVACDSGELVTGGAAFTQAAGPEGGILQHVAATADVVVASTGQSLHRSTDGGLTWALVEAERLRGAVIQGVVARRDEIFVALWDGTLRSRDGGVTWDDVSGPQNVGPGYMSVHGDDLYGTWVGAPIRWDAKSEQWVALPVGNHSFFDVIESDGRFIYANAIYEPGVFRLPVTEPSDAIGIDTRDAEHGPWVRVEGLSEWGYRAFAFRDGVSFASNDQHVFESIDGGERWGAVELNEAVTVADFLVVGDAVHAATDRGVQTRNRNGEWTSSPIGWFGSGNSLATDGTHVFAAADGLHRTSSESGPWQEMPIRADGVWSMVAAGDVLLVASRTGLHRSADRGATWSATTLPAGQSFSGDAVVNDDELLVLGTRALLASRDGGESFSVRPLALARDDEWVNVFTEVDGDLVVGLSRSVGGNCSTAYNVTTELHRSSDGGETWTQPFGALPGTFDDCQGHSRPPMISSVTRVGGALIAASAWTGLFRSVDDGATWSQVELAVDFSGMDRFAVVGDVVVGIVGYGSGVARSLDGGVTWRATGLDGHHVLDLIAVGETLFAASTSSVGEPTVHFSSDAGETWAPVDAGFRTEATALAVVGDQLFAGTPFASVWTARLKCAPKP